MNKALFIGVAALAFSCAAAEDGFTEIFDGKTLDGWETRGGDAFYVVSNGCIRGECVMHVPFNTFLITKRHYENFIFRCEFLCEYSNSGLQFRSGYRYVEKNKRDLVSGYQSEITPRGENNGRIYDEARRGFKGGFTWLDVGTHAKTADAARASCATNGVWNRLEIVCCGPHIRTIVNGITVADVLDDEQQKGFFGLQIHAQMHDFKRPGVTWWRNIRVKELGGEAVWKTVDAKPADGRVDAGEYGDVMARAVLPKGVPLSALVVRGIPWKSGRPEVFGKLFNPKGANEVSTIVYGDRVVHRLNGLEVFDGPLAYCGGASGGRGKVEILTDKPGCRLRVCALDGLKEE